MSAPLTGRFDDPIQAPGTEERLWREWSGWAGLPEITLPRSGRVVVVAAHPDDEVLGFGGSLALLAASEAEVTVVVLTDGEGSHPHSRTVTPEELVRLRAAETRAALAELGAAHVQVVRWGVADTEVAKHERRITERLHPLVTGAALVVAPWTGDVHSDHEAAGRAALAAAGDAATPCWLYPVWMWHWARPDDPRVPWHRAARVTLTEPVRARKRAAVARYASQIRPLGPDPEDAAILPPEEIAHHLREREVVFR
ncbi:MULTISPECIES: PIG-L family deacetylase [unclassified Streptomyces]|uniref:PIG-L deacetylase family protein n=1 Tax=unclassified Streptomyces TaxID=2593676 RepID=UPI0033AF7F74|nr:PIG-L family deacetylase [Streptomyces sp. NBC_01176]